MPILSSFICPSEFPVHCCPKGESPHSRAMLELRTWQCKKVALSQHHDCFCRFKPKTAPCASETYGIGVSNRAERDVGIYSRHVPSHCKSTSTRKVSSSTDTARPKLGSYWRTTWVSFVNYIAAVCFHSTFPARWGIESPKRHTISTPLTEYVNVTYYSVFPELSFVLETRGGIGQSFETFTCKTPENSVLATDLQARDELLPQPFE